MSSNPIADSFLSYAATRLHQCQKTIATCLDKLSDEQALHRGGDHENSIVNLLVHLEGNLRQWILHGIDNQPDVRRRDDEFTLTPTTSPADARARFNATVDQAARVIAALPAERLLEVIDPQPTGLARHLPILEAIFKIVGHVDHHTGQIILLTKQLSASDVNLSLPRKR